MIRRLPIAGIMGSGDPEHYPEVAAEVGRRVAAAGCHLLTGGGGGTMEEAARGFSSVTERAGLSIGIIPARRPGSSHAPPGYPNPFVELPIRTHLARSIDPDDLGSRNPINILTADGLIFLAGSGGTEAELSLARNFDKPRILLLDEDQRIGTLSPEDLRAAGETVTGDLGEIDSFLKRLKRA